jgi:hypothetical protein
VSDITPDVLGVLCEVLYNVAEESRLKSKYWKAQVKNLTAESR